MDHAATIIQEGFEPCRGYYEHHPMIEGWVNPQEDKKLYAMGREEAYRHLIHAEADAKTESQRILSTYPHPEHGDYFAKGFMDYMKDIASVTKSFDVSKITGFV